MSGEIVCRKERGWDDACEEYTCGDEIRVVVPHKTAGVRDPRGSKTVPKNGVRYARDARTHSLETRIGVSGAGFCRDMGTIFGGAEGIRTIVFPKTVKTAR